MAKLKRFGAKGAQGPAQEGPVVWAFGGGKGGVGKSIVASNLSVALAKRGQRCVIVDADLGAANLHTLLGVERPTRTLSSFLTGETPQLSDVLADTPFPGLQLLSGARALNGMADLGSEERRGLLEQVSALRVEHVVLDLGAGSAAGNLDYFLAAHRGVLVATPEPTSVENAYHFLQSAFFRSVHSLAGRSPLRTALRRGLAGLKRRRSRAPRDLIGAMSEIDGSAAELLREGARRFKPLLVVNQASTEQDRGLGTKIRNACRDYLGAEIGYLGALARDEAVRDAVLQREPTAHLFPDSPFAHDLEALVDRVLDGRTDSSGEDTGTAPGLERPGRYLRARREQLGLSLCELRERTRIGCLESLEQERFDLLPPEFYLRGFVEEYARSLGLAEADRIAVAYMGRLRHARGVPATQTLRSAVEAESAVAALV